MSSKGVSAGNSLSLLMGDYNSDSENDDNENTINQMDNKLQEFLTDLNTIVTTNWTQCIDQSTGHPYYWNTLTKDVTWDMPAEYDKFLKQNLRSKNSNNENSYTVCYTDDKVPYYVNEFTRQVSWEKPTEFAEKELKGVNLEKNSKKSKKLKNSIADRDNRNGRRKKSKKQEKTAKKYPFAGDDDLDHVKIELISSFAAKSDSSSEDEIKSKKPKTNFNLVANDYNSDDNSDNDTKVINDKPLFASLSTNVTIEPSAVKIYSLKTDFIDNANTKRTVSPTEEPEPIVVEKPTSTLSKPNTFASIITGGRSPNGQENELMELMKREASEPEPQQDVNSQADQPIELDVKNFKRKRRIEFMTRPVLPAKSSIDTVVTDISVSDSRINESEKEVINPSVANKQNEEPSTKGLYANFLRANIEFSDVTDQNNSEKVSDKLVDDEFDKHKSGISDLRSIIESKLKFLCNGRPDVSAVQAIFIQFETLLEAYDEQALQPAYIQRWLDGISSDLLTLENDAAPVGWKCLWNRKKSQYCYKHLTTGDIRWEYPENNKPDEAVEMDICTTPPPNLDEQFNVEQSMVNSICTNGDDNATAYTHVQDSSIPVAPPPPIISYVDIEPPPPGTDLEVNKEKPSEKINSELASFYSEMASFDTNSMHDMATELPTSSSESVKISNENATTDGVVKKKKKKVKKSEPWRSGNLETWINKWQKAQKELDG